MPNQKGGVKKMNPDKQPENILHDTLQSAGVVLNVISDSSYKSFVLEIIINDPAAREYIDTDQSGRFSNPVERLVMKILITTPPPPPPPLTIPPTPPTTIPSFGNQYIDMNNVQRYKAPETPNDIITEARVQQEAWIKTVVNGRVPVCPSVADLIFFDNQNGITFITYLRGKFATGNPRVNNVCAYILQKLQFGNSRGICVMVMPEVSAPAQVLTAAAAAQAAAQAAAPQAAAPQASITLDGFIKLTDGSNFQGLTVDQIQKDRAYSLITACDMRLYWVGIIDFDLHADNFLLYVDEHGELQGKIIDLGNSIIFTNGTNKFLVDQADINRLITGLERYKNDIIVDFGNNTFNRKRDFVVGLLDMIKAFDTKGNHQVFPYDRRFDITIPEGQNNHTNCQMSWWQTIKDKEAADLAGTDHSFSNIINNAYDIARVGFIVDIDARNSGVSYRTIQRYITEGKIPSFDNINPVLMAGWQLPAAQAQALQGPPQGAQAQALQGQVFQGPPQGAQAQVFQGQVFQGAQAQALQGQALQAQALQGQVFPGQGSNDMDYNIGGGARKKTSKKRKFRKNKTKRFALRKTKSKKRRRTSKK